MIDKVKEYMSANKWVLIPIIAVPVLLILFIILFAVNRGGGAQNMAENAVPGVLRAGFVVAEDQYTYKDGSGTLAGIEPDLAARAAETEGVTLQAKEYTKFEDALTALETGELDVLFGRVSDTNPLIGNLLVSDSYGQSGLYFITGRYDYTDTLAQMGGKSLGVYAMVKTTSQTVPYIDGVGNKEYTDIDILVQDVIQGNIDLGLVDERNAVKYISEDLQAQEVLNGPMEHYVAVFAANTPHRAAVNSAIGDYYNVLSTAE